MALLKNKIILLLCLFLHFEKAHFQFDDEDGQDDFPQRYSRESSKRKKYETGWRSEDDQDQEQMQAQDPEQDPDEQLWPRDHRECPTSICSAENANALRFEKPWPKKLGSASKFNKAKDDKDVHNMPLKCDEDDDDDGDDGDDDDEDDDDDDEADDDEYLSDGEQEAFLARMRCLMKSLDTHTRAIHRNLKILQSRINKAKERSSQGSTCRKPDFYTHPKDKWFENPQQEEKENHPEQCVPEATKKVNNRQDTPVYTPNSPHSPQRLLNLQDSQRSESPQGSQSPQRSDYIQDSESSQNLATPQQSQRQQEPQRPQGLQDSQGPESSQGAPGPQSPQSPPSNSDNNLKVSPLLKLLNNPAALQSKPESPGYWAPNPVLTRPEDISVHFNKRSNPRYEEYEARLRRLMANRDAIERNVMKVMGTSRKIPRK
ncbi:uncharacterized protein [Drosophila bipectinata]|uniref:uncharacterized protein n=1 Tax=Drosophila bipectinata TaxID=42026 RepID=UPI001C89BB56|nr:probable serine/threonine-protein kinase fhkB [Drosophila bipectinata]